MNFSQAFEATTLDSFVTGQVRKKMDAMADVLKAELDAAQGHIRVLNVLYHKGDIGITTDEFEENLENLETKIVLCQVNLAVLQRHKNQFIGEYIDDMGTQFDGRRIDDALTIFKSRDAAAQERFRNDVFSEYDANFGEHKWCCISGYTEDSCDVVAAHIVPYNMGEVNAEYLFGKSDPSMKNGHIMSSHNGIPMLKRYEEMFDDGRMTLVPVPGTTKIRVVVFSALDPNPTGTAKQLHGKELSFRNDFRPSNRYLYYHYAISLLRRQRHAAPGWWRTFGLYGRHTTWATPGQFLRQSSMLTLARDIGHLPPEEANFFMSPQGLPESEAPEFDGPDDAQKDLEIAAAINMKRGPFGLRTPFIRERRGSDEVWKLDSHISEEFAGYCNPTE
ncbi:hypothetical protein BGZ61DRAFT_550647 [Ilyonectria robusta]|uniref:uncharacterized protein n=1 Tax=Ilyonectria robusta TaxID=1079257 RepID=UPI001E8DDA3B|nr:uncharacterized protein BGZ61DRAFT_550647 [Ilyonectria robusta]KAH8683716.1 hypothetical protein BGZ61DRAFT_550647 [Ilyonectria robusta]